MKRVNRYRPTGPDDRTLPVLRAFNNHLPADGRANFVHHLKSLTTDQEIHAHAESLVNSLLMPMQTVRPRLGMEHPIDNIAYREARLKADCLTRDGMRCVITGDFDRHSRDIHGNRSPLGYTECVHMLPLSLATWKDSVEECAQHIIWSNLLRYFPSLQTTLNFTRENIDDTMNAMTMRLELREAFGSFNFTFEETTSPGRYRLKNYDPGLLRALPRTITFSQHDPSYALPSPELLKVHAAIAAIIHASGQGGYIDKAIQGLGETSALAKDGSTDISSLLAASSLGALSSLVSPVQTGHPELRPSDSQ